MPGRSFKPAQATISKTNELTVWTENYDVLTTSKSEGNDAAQDVAVFFMTRKRSARVSYKIQFVSVKNELASYPCSLCGCDLNLGNCQSFCSNVQHKIHFHATYISPFSFFLQIPSSKFYHIEAEKIHSLLPPAVHLHMQHASCPAIPVSWDDPTRWFEPFLQGCI